MILDDVRKHYRDLWGDPSREAEFKDGSAVGSASVSRTSAVLILVVLAAAPVLSPSSAGRPVADEPLPIYARDPRDAWNRIFQQLFTRTVRTRVSEEFGQGAPFTTPAYRPFPARLRVSTRLFERFEDGDRAV